MRLIDADLAKQKIIALEHEPAYQHEGEDWAVGLCMAESVLDEIPTSDIAAQIIKDICQIGGCSRGVVLNPWDIEDLKQKYGVK